MSQPLLPSPPASPIASAADVAQSSAGGAVALVESSGAGQSLVRVSEPSLSVPLPLVAPGPAALFNIPIRFELGAVTSTQLATPAIVAVRTQTNQPLLNLLNGFAYAHFVSLQLRLTNTGAWPYAILHGLGGWTFDRGDTNPTGTVVSNLPSSHVIRMGVGESMLIECSFGGLVSPLASHSPIIGARASFYAYLRLVNTHPFVPMSVTQANPQGTPQQPAIPNASEVLSLQLWAIVAVGGPLPGLTRAIP